MKLRFGRRRRRPRRQPRLKSPKPIRRSAEAVVRMRSVYILLTATILVAGYATIRYPDVLLVERFGPNLATEALGIVVTLAVVHRLLERRERAGKLRASIGALRKGGQALGSLAETWATVVKGSFRHSPDTLPRSVHDCLVPFLTSDLIYCDPQRPRRVAGETARPWVRWAADRLAEGQRALREVVDAYGVSLDPAYLEAIDELVDDPFVALFKGLADGDATDAREWYVQLNVARGHREAHFTRLLHAIDLHNELAREAARFRSRTTAPKTDSIGIELPLDHDLRAHTEIDPGWWQREPLPGSLRVDAKKVPAGD